MFNTMASTLREKDRTSIGELKQYMENLEKQFDYPKQNQGKQFLKVKTRAGQ